MGFRYRKSIKLGGGIRLNMSKSGIGISAGVKGFRVGVGPRGTRTTISLPGTGLSYVKENRTRNSSNISSSRLSNITYTKNFSPIRSYLNGVNDDRPALPKKKLFGSNKEYKKIKSILDNIDLALERFDREMYDHSLLLLNDLINSLPNCQFLIYAKAIVLVFLGESVEAYGLFKSLPYVQNQELQTVRIKSAIELSDYKETLNMISQLQRDRQLTTQIIFYKAICFVELQEWNTALEALKDFNTRKAENKGGPTCLYHYMKAVCYKNTGKKKSAISEYEKSLSFPIGIDVQSELNELRKQI